MGLEHLFWSGTAITFGGSGVTPDSGGTGHCQQGGRGGYRHLGCRPGRGACSAGRGIRYGEGEIAGGCLQTPVFDSHYYHGCMVTTNSMGNTLRPIQETAHLRGMRAPVGMDLGIVTHILCG